MTMRDLLIASAVSSMGLIAGADAMAGLVADYHFSDTGATSGAAISASASAASTAWNLADLSTAGFSPQYSNLLPGTQIYDPISNSWYSNTLSMRAASTSTNTSRLRTSTSQLGDLSDDNSFSTEFFFRINTEPSSTVRFAFRRVSTAGVGGWEMNYNPTNNTLGVDFYIGGTKSSGVTLSTVLPSDSETLNSWFHVGLIVTGNATAPTGGYLFLNQEQVDSTALTSSQLVLAGQQSNPFYAGLVLAGYGGDVNIDEVRFHDSALALDGSQFLTIPEPAGLALLGLSGGVLFIRRRQA